MQEMNKGAVSGRFHLRAVFFFLEEKGRVKPCLVTELF